MQDTLKPPQFLGYRHFRHELFLTDDGGPQFCQGRHNGEDRKCANMIAYWNRFKRKMQQHAFYFGVGMGKTRAC